VTAPPHVPDHLLDDAQRAARDLLVHGLVTPTSPDVATFARVRRWAAWLTASFEDLTGWVVHDTRAGVRLERRSDQLDGRGWWPDSEHVPGARLLSLTCLVLAALERADDQVLLTDLATMVRTAALRAEVPFDVDVHVDRRAFCLAVRALEGIGVLLVRDGQLEAWRDRSGVAEALIDVERDVVRLLVLPPRPLQLVDSAAELLQPDAPGASREVVRGRRRQRLTRMLLDRTCVLFDDLDEADRTYLRLEIGSLAAEVERLTGAIVERRAEGVAVVMAHGGGGIDTFPSQDGATVAALALVHDLLEAAATPGAIAVARPHGGPPAPTRYGTAPPPPSEDTTLPLVPDAALVRAASRHVARLGEALRRDLREPESFVRAAIDRLSEFDLVRPVPGGVCVMPALARFRDATLRTTSPSAR
jgi:uncharacterized protein (TIGR02678 family)